MDKRTVLVALTLVVSWLWADESIDRDYYRSTILPGGNGVYEREGVLYVHSTAPYSPRNAISSKTNRLAKLNALLGVDSLLKTWAVSNTAPLRVASQEYPKGLEYARKVLASLDPNWRFAAWSLDSLPTRQLHNAAEGERYVCGFAIQKETLLAALPAEFRRPCSEAEVLVALPKWVGVRLLGKTPMKMLTLCGVCDLAGIEGVEAAAVDEFRRANEEVKKYFTESKFGRDVREEERRLSIPECVTNRTEQTNVQGTLSIVRTEVVTTTRVPRFQRLLLNPQSETNAPSARLESGAKAVEAAFDQKRKLDEQTALLKSALEENPGDKELWNLYGRMLLKQSETAAAVVCFRNALKLDAKFIYAQVNLGTAYRLMGCPKLAWGLAVAARSVATDKWSIEQSESLLLDGRSATLATVPPGPSSTAISKPIDNVSVPQPIKSPPSADKRLLANEINELNF